MLEVGTFNWVEAIRNQFGNLPELQRRYDNTMQYRIADYNPQAGFVRFETASIIPKWEDAAEYFKASGSSSEYLLPDPKDKTRRLNRIIHRVMDLEGKISIGLVSVDIKSPEKTILYDVEDWYSEDLDHLEIKVLRDAVKDPQAFFPDGLLMRLSVDKNGTKNVCIPNGEPEEIEAFYRKERLSFGPIKPETLMYPSMEFVFGEDAEKIEVYSPSVLAESAKIGEIDLGEKFLAKDTSYSYQIFREGKIYRIIRHNGNTRGVWNITFSRILNPELIAGIIKDDAAWQEINKTCEVSFGIK